MTKRHRPKPPVQKRSPQPEKKPKPQTHKSVALYALAYCPWHSDRTPKVASSNGRKPSLRSVR